MIKTRADLQYYIECDKRANSFPQESSLKKLLRLFFPNDVLNFLVCLRTVEFYHNNLGMCVLKRILGGGYFRFRLRKLSYKLGYSIPINVFGPGLSLPHCGTIVVSANARIGKNCRLHACTNIGASGGNPDASTIGDNVYIGPGAILFGGIHIANNVTIGANATVNKSVEDENVVVAGTPASIVKEHYPNWITINKVEM